jgi:hypothetical protein
MRLSSEYSDLRLETRTEDPSDHSFGALSQAESPAPNSPLTRALLYEFDEVLETPDFDKIT